MTKLNWWKWATMTVGIVVASWAAVGANPLSGSIVESVATIADDKPNTYQGNANCMDCHNNGDQSKRRPELQYFVQYNEYTTWIDHDKHSLAYKNLLGPRANKMKALLKLEDLTALSAGCIGCHGAGLPEKNDLIRNKLFNPSDGVTCENCHGPSSNWSSEHAKLEFRDEKTESREKMGFVDLRLPDRQATQCLSCHLGNSEEGKVVTHEMYAAGHPPLPSIEVATFSDVIPRHWWLVAEKRSERLRKAVGFVEGTKEKTRLSLVGAAVALKTSMKLIADETKATGSTTVPGLAWPDYARFDCWSCHHDLKRESWRQVRGYESAPGRPPINEWPLAIVKLGIARLEFEDPTAKVLQGELLEQRNAVLSSSTAKPYGKKAAMAEAAEKFAKWSDSLIKRLSTAPYDDAIALKLLKRLVEDTTKDAKEGIDYDTARHIGWTIDILVADAGDKLKDKPAIEAVLVKLRDGLKLKLPAGREYEIEDQLGPALQVIADYEPSMFLGHIKELQAILDKP